MKRAVFAFVFAAALGGCREPLLPPSQSACGDPCGAMVCPNGSSCTWNTKCQAHCEVQPLSPNGH